MAETFTNNFSGLLQFCEKTAPACSSAHQLSAKISEQFGKQSGLNKLFATQLKLHTDGAGGCPRIAAALAKIKSKPAAAKPAPAITPKAIGEAVLKTTLSTDPKISTPARAALSTIADLSAQIAAARALPTAERTKALVRLGNAQKSAEVDAENARRSGFKAHQARVEAARKGTR